eukprot:scaffold34922_cov141-Amphora_coffeaeformis.AAC.2
MSKGTRLDAWFDGRKRMYLEWLSSTTTTKEQLREVTAYPPCQTKVVRSAHLPYQQVPTFSASHYS